jgi:hypothetical protein
MHHLYGIMERSPQPGRLPSAGVDDGCVLARRIGGFTVLSSLVHCSPRPSRFALTRHLEIQAAAAVPGPLFPLPFGVTVPTDTLEQWLAVRAGTVRVALRMLKGCADAAPTSASFRSATTSGWCRVALRVVCAIRACEARASITSVKSTTSERRRCRVASVRNAAA